MSPEGPARSRDIRILPAGDLAVLVEFSGEISPEINRLVHALDHALTLSPITGVVETLPTYRSLLVVYDPDRVGSETLFGELGQRAEAVRPDLPLPGRRITIPVCYDREFAPDLEALAVRHGLSVDEVIRLHTSAEFLVYFIGFTPGLPYLGGLPERLVTPRLERPRVRVSAGSVGIGGRQCTIYPIESPGGFHIIGRTPRCLYDPERDPPVLLRPGDTVVFTAIPRSEFGSAVATETPR